jgi:hypothetical protein
MPLDATPLLDAVDRLADRFRSLPVSGLRARVPGFESRAAAGLALARTLAEAAQRLEAPDREPRRMPEAGVFAVGDQIAVAGHDLVTALAATQATDQAEDTAGNEAADKSADKPADKPEDQAKGIDEGEPARILVRALEDVAATEQLVRARRS